MIEKVEMVRCDICGAKREIESMEVEDATTGGGFLERVIPHGWLISRSIGNMHVCPDCAAIVKRGQGWRRLFDEV